MVQVYQESSPAPAFERLSVFVTPIVDLTNFEIKAHPSCEMINLIRNQSTFSSKVLLDDLNPIPRVKDQHD